jgi:transcription termination/antitermination protein NusG
MSAQAAAECLAAPKREPRWYACITRSRHEKRVATVLKGRRLEFYLPLVPEWRQWKDRRKQVLFPLFPGYVFVRFPLAEALQVLTVPGVSGVVRAHGEPIAVREAELENVRRFATALRRTEAPVEAVEYLAEGRRVRVVRGPFTGICGTVVRSGRRVVIGLEQIGQGVAINIDSRCLEPFAD